MDGPVYADTEIRVAWRRNDGMSPAPIIRSGMKETCWKEAVKNTQSAPRRSAEGRMISH